LISANETIEHAGMVIGAGGEARPAFRGFPADDPGVCRQLQITRNYSAVSSACLLTRREVFMQVGGFDEEVSMELAGIDLCLKMRRAGYLIVYTPFAKLCRRVPEVQPTTDDRSAVIMHERWGEALKADPYYNPNLSRARADFSLGN
jgi:O-antigen biosynthesis protein